jgi:FSR family fosmidomycin resistance protein-like MFS transporter
MARHRCFTARSPIWSGPNAAGARSAFYTGTIGAGALAPAIYGVLGDALGVPAALIVVAAVVLLTLPLSLVLKPALAARLP